MPFQFPSLFEQKQSFIGAKCTKRMLFMPFFSKNGQNWSKSFQKLPKKQLYTAIETPLTGGQNAYQRN